MKKILIIILFFSFFYNSANAKIFKSKNGYSFIVPSGHKVIEIDIKKAASNVEKSDAANSMDKELLQDSLDVNVQYVTYIVLKKERKPDQFNSNITASKDPVRSIRTTSRLGGPRDVVLLLYAVSSNNAQVVSHAK